MLGARNETRTVFSVTSQPPSGQNVPYVGATLGDNIARSIATRTETRVSVTITFSLSNVRGSTLCSSEKCDTTKTRSPMFLET
jgi:hypothetical protein